jgi:hypothetical protein
VPKITDAHKAAFLDAAKKVGMTPEWTQTIVGTGGLEGVSYQDLSAAKSYLKDGQLANEELKAKGKRPEVDVKSRAEVVDAIRAMIDDLGFVGAMKNTLKEGLIDAFLPMTAYDLRKSPEGPSIG